MGSKYIYPFMYETVKGKVTQLFGQWPGGNNPRGGHTGIDFAVPEGTAVLAPADGVIEFEGWVTGNYWENPWWFLPSDMVIVVNCGIGLPSFTMGHLSATLVNHGDRVKKGQVIGYSGNTGVSTGPHCHFEYLPDNWDYQNGTYGRLDPQLVCEYWDGKPDVPATQPMPILDTTSWGIDTSNFQGDINIAAINPDWVFVRATEGAGVTDEWMEATVRKARNAGKKVGFYHYSHIGQLDGNTPDAEALYCLGAVKRLWKPGDKIVLDWEHRYSQLGNGLMAARWMDLMLAGLGAEKDAAVFYTNLGILNEYHDGLKPYREKYPNLWLAYYGDESMTWWGDPAVKYGTPSIPAGWRFWAWQYTQGGRVPGHAGALDLNIIYEGADVALTDDDIRKWLNFQAFDPAPGEKPTSISQALKEAHQVYLALFFGGKSTPDERSLITLWKATADAAVNASVKANTIDTNVKALPEKLGTGGGTGSPVPGSLDGEYTIKVEKKA